MNIKNIQDINRPSGTVVFVTGVTGQDGSHMVDYLLANTSASVIGGARRLSVENHINLAHLENEPRFQLVNFDLTDSHSIYKIVEYAKPDYFINFAAQTFVASSWDFARQTWESNTTAVLDCLEAIKRMKPDCRFYNAGSSEEFGDVSYEPQDEKHPAKPRSPYGASKVAARQLVKVYRESYGLYAVQGWLFNHEGIRRGVEFVTRKISKGVTRISLELHNNKDVTPIVLGNLDAKRDWSDAEDMMDAVWRMMNQEKSSCLPWAASVPTKGDTSEDWHKFIVGNIKDYVVGGGENYTIRNFVEGAFECVGIIGGWIGDGLEEKFMYGDTPLVVVSKEFYRPAEVNVLRANPKLIKNELGWEPKISFGDLVRKMVNNDLTLAKKGV